MKFIIRKAGPYWWSGYHVIDAETGEVVRWFSTWGAADRWIRGEPPSNADHWAGYN